MPRARRIVQNIFSNWFSLAVSTGVGFFISPFVVHHLGNLTYGVWVITLSFVSYMNLLDLGLRGAVTRFVSKGTAEGNNEDASRAVSAALWIRLWISLAIVVAGFTLSVIFHRIFVIPPELQNDARIAILLTCVSVAITLWSGVFGSVLVALHRFDLSSAVSILQTCFRAAGIVLLLRSGHGIRALAFWELCTSLVANGATIFLCIRVFPQLKLAFGRPDRPTLSKLWNYSFYAFLINIAVQVAYYSDNLVVGAFLSPAAVTMYAIGGMLISYARVIITSMTATFTPLASNFDAVGNFDNLRRLVIHGTRAALVIALPIEAALFFRGHTFINLWMGPQYAETSGTVMQILLLSVLFASANTTSVGIVFGMGKHKRIAFWGIGEAIANLVLSIILVRRIGIYGVAWGSAIPSVFCEVVLWPAYVSKLVAIPVRTYLWQTWIRTGLGAIPFALACAFSEHYWHPRNLLIFFLQIGVLLPLVPLTLALIFREEITVQWRAWRKRRSVPQTLGATLEESQAALHAASEQ
ncbi:MAG: lipopolysaccharide biosynthesis protein [Terriglobales bacterium]